MEQDPQYFELMAAPLRAALAQYPVLRVFMRWRDVETCGRTAAEHGVLYS